MAMPHMFYKRAASAKRALIFLLFCFRMMSLHDGCKQGIVDSGGTSVLLPLLASKVDHVRWCARQVPAIYS